MAPIPNCLPSARHPKHHHCRTMSWPSTVFVLLIVVVVMLAWLIDVFVLLCAGASAYRCTAASCRAPLVLCWFLLPLVHLSSRHHLLPQPNHPLAGCRAYASHPIAVLLSRCHLLPRPSHSMVGHRLSSRRLPELCWWQWQHHRRLHVPLVLCLAVASRPPLVAIPAPRRRQWQKSPCLCVPLLPAGGEP